MTAAAVFYRSSGLFCTPCVVVVSFALITIVGFIFYYLHICCLETGIVGRPPAATDVSVIYCWANLYHEPSAHLVPRLDITIIADFIYQCGACAYVFLFHPQWWINIHENVGCVFPMLLGVFGGLWFLLAWYSVESYRSARPCRPGPACSCIFICSRLSVYILLCNSCFVSRVLPEPISTGIIAGARNDLAVRPPKEHDARRIQNGKIVLSLKDQRTLIRVLIANLKFHGQLD